MRFQNNSISACSCILFSAAGIFLLSVVVQGNNTTHNLLGSTAVQTEKVTKLLTPSPTISNIPTTEFPSGNALISSGKHEVEKRVPSANSSSTSNTPSRLVPESTQIPTTSISPSITSISVKKGSATGIPAKSPTSSRSPSLKRAEDLLPSKPKPSLHTIALMAEKPTNSAPIHHLFVVPARGQPQESTLTPTTSASPSKTSFLVKGSSSGTPINSPTLSTLPSLNQDVKSSKPIIAPNPKNATAVKAKTTILETRAPAKRPTAPKSIPMSTLFSVKNNQTTIRSPSVESATSSNPTIGEKVLLSHFPNSITSIPTKSPALIQKPKTQAPEARDRTREPKSSNPTLPPNNLTKKPKITAPTSYPSSDPTKEMPSNPQVPILAPSNASIFLHSANPILNVPPSFVLVNTPHSNTSQILTGIDTIRNQTKNTQSSKNKYIFIALLTVGVAVLLLTALSRRTIIRLRENSGYRRSVMGRDGSFPIATTPRRSKKGTFREETQQNENTETVISFDRNNSVIAPPSTQTVAPVVSSQGALFTSVVLEDATIPSPFQSKKSGTDCSSTLGFLNTMSTTSGSVEFKPFGIGSDNFAASSESPFVHTESLIDESFPADEMSVSNGNENALKENSLSTMPDESLDEDMFFFCGERWFKDEEDILHEESIRSEDCNAAVTGRGYEFSVLTRRSDAKYRGKSDLNWESRNDSLPKLRSHKEASRTTPLLGAVSSESSFERLAKGVIKTPSSDIDNSSDEGYRTDSSNERADDYGTRESLSVNSDSPHSSLDRTAVEGSSYTPGRSSAYATSETTDSYWSSSRPSTRSKSSDTKDSSYNYWSNSDSSGKGSKRRPMSTVRRRFSLSPLPPRKPYL